VSETNEPVIKIKPSLIPYTWKGLALALLGLAIYVETPTLLPRLQSVSPVYAPLSVLNGVALLLVLVGALGVLVGVVRRNMFTYLITNSEVTVQKQFLRRSVRRIPFASLSDVEVSQTLVGRIAGYGNVAPVTKSGYGLVRGMDRAENITAEMTNVPNPDKVASIVLTRASSASKSNVT
jgi:uncharacterized membrane protein YdbT with pleckstrin-like domain